MSEATQQGELYKKISNNSIPDYILKDESIIFHKNLFPILDAAKADFPLPKETDNLVENGQLPPLSDEAVMRVQISRILAWYIKWFGAP